MLVGERSGKRPAAGFDCLGNCVRGIAGRVRREGPKQRTTENQSANRQAGTVRQSGTHQVRVIGQPALPPFHPRESSAANLAILRDRAHRLKPR